MMRRHLGRLDGLDDDLLRELCTDAQANVANLADDVGMLS